MSATNTFLASISLYVCVDGWMGGWVHTHILGNHLQQEHSMAANQPGKLRKHSNKKKTVATDHGSAVY